MRHRLLLMTVKNRDGKYPLDIASRNCNNRVIAMMLHIMPAFNYTKDDDGSFLHLLAMHVFADAEFIHNALQSRKHQLSIRDWWCLTPLERAVSVNNTVAMQAFESHMAMDEIIVAYTKTSTPVQYRAFHATLDQRLPFLVRLPSAIRCIIHWFLGCNPCHKIK